VRNTSGWDADKLKLCGLATEEASCVAPPRLAGALAWLECSVGQRLEAGDYIFFIARVLVACAEESFDGGWGPDRAAVLQRPTHDRFGHYIDREVS